MAADVGDSSYYETKGRLGLFAHPCLGRAVAEQLIHLNAFQHDLEQVVLSVRTYVHDGLQSRKLQME